MTDKRGTGVDYGQEKLQARAENFDSDVNSETKKPKSKLSVLGVIIVAIIGVGALYPVVFGGKQTPKEKVEEVVPVKPDGTPDLNSTIHTASDAGNSFEKASADKASADKAAADKASADKAAADKAAADKAAADKAAADKAAADKAAADKKAADTAATVTAAADKAAADTAAADTAGTVTAGTVTAAADKAVAEKSTDATEGVASKEDPIVTKKAPGSTLSHSNSPEQDLLDIAAPSNPTSEILPSDKVVSTSPSNQLPAEDVKGIAKAVVSDPTVKATDEAQAEASTSSNSVKPFRDYDASKFGIGSGVTVKQRSNSQNEVPNSPPQQVLPNDNDPAQLNEPGTIKNYVGQTSEVTYEKQSQNTVYLYGQFAAKVYLLPLNKGESINYYLTDKKGWDVKLLPGNILRINRSSDKAAWTDATDLFLVAGKRTYSMILQAVERPQDRTDSLVFATPHPAKPSKK